MQALRHSDKIRYNYNHKTSRAPITSAEDRVTTNIPITQVTQLYKVPGEPYAVVAVEVIPDNLNFFSQHSDAMSLLSLAIAAGVTGGEVADDAEENLEYLIYTATAPRIWDVDGTFTDPSGQAQVIGETAGILLYRKTHNEPNLDTGSTRLVVKQQGPGDWRLAWTN